MASSIANPYLAHRRDLDAAPVMNGNGRAGDPLDGFMPRKVKAAQSVYDRCLFCLCIRANNFPTQSYEGNGSCSPGVAAISRDL